MTLGPLEYVVIGVQNDHGMDEILPALSTIEETDALRVLDLLVVCTDGAGAVTVQEVNAGGSDEGPTDTSPTTARPGLLTAEDVQTLAAQMPANATALVVLLEHTWARTLTAAVQRAGGVLYTGGLVPPEVLAQLGAELAAAEAATSP